MVDPYQVAEARSLGADCILVIMAALSDTEALELTAAATAWSMDVLVETHNAKEIERAKRLSPTLIGINNRNLKTLDVDLATTEALAPMVTTSKMLNSPVVVSESGLHTRADLDRMADIGVSCFLVGESLMRQDDVAAATRNLLDANVTQGSA
jgi:indole-3-glycerol phosphate synthase